MLFNKRPIRPKSPDSRMYPQRWDFRPDQSQIDVVGHHLRDKKERKRPDVARAFHVTRLGHMETDPIEGESSQ